MDCWLSANRRAYWWICLPLALLCLASFCLAFWPNTLPDALPDAADSSASGAVAGFLSNSLWWLFRAAGAVVGIASFLTLLTFSVAMRRPRVAFVDEHVRLDLRFGPPIDVPLDVVECFFMGQGPSFVANGPVGQAAATNVVVRLAERAKDWHERDVRSSLGKWSDGYITIRGAWCEPIDGQVVEGMNKKLAAVKRARKAALASEST